MINPDARLKKEYGGVKAALIYCVDMGLNKAQSAQQLNIDISTLRNRADRFKISFPDPYLTRDMTLTKEVNRENAIRRNKNRTFGRNTIDNKSKIV